MTDAASADAARSSVPEVPLAFEPTSETHRFYCDPAEDASRPVAFSRAPRGVAGGEDLFAPARALLESVTLGEYLEARRSEAPERFVTTLDVSTTADEALRVLARASAHAAPLVDKERRAFLGFLDVDDLLSGFFARLERAIPPPSMPPNPAAAAAHAERRAETASGERSRSSPSPIKKTESFVREEGRRRWIAGVDKTSLAEAVRAFATSTLSDLRRARAGAEDGRMVYRGARDASLLELVRSGFLRPVAKPAAFAETGVKKTNTDAEDEADDSRASVPARSPTVADVPARATTCHRVATYRLRLDAEWRSDAMVVDAIVSQWDVCRFLRDRVAKRNDDARLRSAFSLGSRSPADAFRASLRELGMVSDASGDDSDSHQRVVTVTLRTSVLEAFSKMRAAGVSCAGVTCEAYDGESAGPLVGVITANDFRVAFCGPGQSRRLPDWVAGELLGSVDAFLYRIRTVRLFWERRTVRGGLKDGDGERDSPHATPATTYLRSVTRDASLFEALDALVTDATHHVFVVDAFHGRAVRVITPADVLRAVAAPGRAAIGWRYRERSDARESDPPRGESASREKKTSSLSAGDEKTFADGVRRAGGCLGALEISDDFKKRDDERNGGVPVGFAGRFDDEM